MEEKLAEAAEALARRARSAVNATDAQQYAQATLSMVHALVTIINNRDR